MPKVEMLGFTRALHPWIPDTGDGYYRNPVIHADYSDPDVIRHGKDFYLVSSSFICTPGLPVLHSRDLVNWRIINHAICNVPHPTYDAEVRAGCGAWAPSIRFHGEKFYVFFPMPDEGIYVTEAEDPAGKWSEPWCLQEAKGWIDPCPFWDEDGSAYLAHAYANSRAGKKERIHLRPMSPDCRRLLGEGNEVIHAPHHPFIEGPKVHKINGWYYILAPGGGVPQGWQVVFRSRHVYGPYEEKVVLEKGSTPINGPHQGALVDLENGAWVFLHFQDAGPFGRIVHMQPVRWDNGWPLMGIDHDGNGVGEPVGIWRKPVCECPSEPVCVPQTDDEFVGTRLGLQWQWQANHREDWISLDARPGWLRFYGQPSATDGNLCRIPHLLMQKFPARVFSAETLVDLPAGCSGTECGLAVTGGDGFASLAICSPDGLRFCRLKCNDQVLAEFPLESGPVRLRVDIDENAVCRFSFAAGDNDYRKLEAPFEAKAGGWIGAKSGIYCSSDSGGYADFDYFRILPGTTSTDPR